MDEVNKKYSYSFREHSLFDLPTGEGLEHDNDGLIIEIYQNKLGKSSHLIKIFKIYSLGFIRI